MGTYLYNGHKVDLFNNPVTGFVAYVDDDLEPHDTTEDEAFAIIQNGIKIK